MGQLVQWNNKEYVVSYSVPIILGLKRNEQSDNLITMRPLNSAATNSTDKYITEQSREV